MKLLLHVCCGPCLIYPLNRLREAGFRLSGLFYNPNIHDLSEYNKRKKAVEYLGTNHGLEFFYSEYSPIDFFRAVNLKEGRPQRCAVCWELRLKETAKAAQEKGFGSFSTTLLVSPYQDQGLLRKIGEDCARREGISFYYEDFRPGFRQAHDLAKAQGIYCQDYCGCIYSQIEKHRKPDKA